MQVGHVDEILKVVRDRRNIPGRPAECAFNIFAADTNLGKELLQRPEFSNRNAITLNLAADIKDTDAYAGTFSTPGGEFLCDAVREAGDSIQPQSPPGSKVLQSMVRFVFPEANAIDVDAAQLRCINGVNNVTNSQLWNAMKDRAPFLEYNALIQAAMDRSKRKMYDKILERLPQCRPFFPDIASMFTPVPNLFSISPASETGSHVTSINGNRELVIGLSGANSLFPNPTNSIMMNNTLIFPGPVTTPYKSYLEEQTRRLGLTPSSVDTWDYAHTGQGNIHCSSHSIPYCSPRGRQ